MAIAGAEANRVGLTPDQVSAAVSGALLGVNAGEVRLDDRSVSVRVRAPDSVRFNPRLLGSLPVYSPQTQSTVPLASLATFTPGETRGELLRENQQQLIVMTADLSGRVVRRRDDRRAQGARRRTRRRPACAWSSAASTRASVRHSARCCSCSAWPRRA